MARIRTIDGRLEIRIRHYAMRFLCLVLFIVSIVGFNNEKQPDGRMIGIGFLVATVLLLLATRSVTIELDRPSDSLPSVTAASSLAFRRRWSSGRGTICASRQRRQVSGRV